jgi:UDP-glucose 4-epimerase
MRHLITGGAGFIGSHLAEALIGSGDEVHVIDDLSTGRLGNLRAIHADRRFALTISRVEDAGDLLQRVEWADVVHHLAAVVGVRRILERPLETLKTNLGGTERVLEAAAEVGRRIIIASTSEVYGKSVRPPFVESGDVVLGATSRSRWGYAASKMLDEFLALAYHQERGLPVTIARLFNTVGPRQVGHYGMVLPNFVRQALAGEPITVHGSGEQTRCFSSVYDVIRCWRALVHSPSTCGQVYNIGSDDEISITDLAILVREVTGSDSPIVRVPYESAYPAGYEDMQRRVPSTAKLEAEIGFRPLTSIRDIVEVVVEHEEREELVTG